MNKPKVPNVGQFNGPAGGWDALAAVAAALRDQDTIVDGVKTLLRSNQPEGFDCPGCAWPDPKHTSQFEFCENGAKAVAWETTSKRADPSFFATHPVAELLTWTDHALEDAGRLTHPMRYNRNTDRFVPIGWDEGFKKIGAALNALPDPNMAEFYTSGRASNEAAFLYQLFVRAFGTNNFPDCSNMCHEATSVGLPASIGVGKGTVTLEDFDKNDLLLSFGHNPGTNHPRMMTTLRNTARRGVPIIAFNPLKERSLERFAAPQAPIEMLTLGSTKISSSIHQVRVGGDVAVLKGMMKRVLELDDLALRAGQPGKLDRDFIAEHTVGFEALKADLMATSWPDIERMSGLSRNAIESAGDAYVAADRVIIAYGMGITQHRSGTANVQQMMNLLLLRGNIGRPGAGIAPIRGHSNVQGDRTVGITEIPGKALLDGIEAVFGFRAPSASGHNAVDAAKAIVAGRAKAIMCLGGNFAVAMSDPAAIQSGIQQLDLAVHLATKLNRTHLMTAQQSLILPVLGRTELDVQASGPQAVTVEDSVSMVHASRGRLHPASDQLRSEPAVIAGIASATLGNRFNIDWSGLIADYDRIRDKIEAVYPEFTGYNERIRKPGGFLLDVPAARREWRTATGRANFLVKQGLCEDDVPHDDGVLILTTLRSHDQYNTTIYGMNDRYRGIFGRRDVIFMNKQDLAEHRLAHGDLVDVEPVTASEDSPPIKHDFKLTAIEYDIPAGCAAAYYPEANVLIGLNHHDPESGTPSYKSVPVRVRRSPPASI